MSSEVRLTSVTTDLIRALAERQNMNAGDVTAVADAKGILVFPESFAGVASDQIGIDIEPYRVTWNDLARWTNDESCGWDYLDAVRKGAEKFLESIQKHMKSLE